MYRHFLVPTMEAPILYLVLIKTYSKNMCTYIIMTYHHNIRLSLVDEGEGDYLIFTHTLSLKILWSVEHYALV